MLSSDCRGEAIGGVTMVGIEGFEGMDMVIGVKAGCSETRVGESKGGEATTGVAVLVASVDGLGEAVFD